MIATHSRKPPDRMPTVEIVPLSSDRDFPEVLLIADASFSNPWTRGVFIRSLERPNGTRALVARSGSCTVGCCVGQVILDELHIHTVAVSPAFRGRGIGRRLLATRMRRSRGQGVTSSILEVRNSNLVAQGLYKKLGFSLLGRRSAYYRDPVEGAVIYSRASRQGSWRGYVRQGCVRSRLVTLSSVC